MHLSGELIEAILQRRRPSPHAPELSGAFSGKRVLITGAGGSIGRALALRLKQLGCARLSLLDNSDHALIETLEALGGPGGGKGASPVIADVLCDVRERSRLTRAFANERPDIVIHAAALKHVHFGDRHPAESVLTNLVGVSNAVEALRDAGGGRFVLVSTDKAASPVSVMGACKRLAELYVRSIDAEGGRVRAVAVRFGNVYGTRGSVAPLFAQQIASGGPVRVTHTDMERYFMLIEEAVDLLLQAAARKPEAAGESPILLMEMGRPIKIVGLAKRMIEVLAPGENIEIVITGPREGEKLTEQLSDEHETLLSSGEDGLWRIQPVAASERVTSRTVADLEAAARGANDTVVRQRLFTALDMALGRLSEAAG